MEQWLCLWSRYAQTEKPEQPIYSLDPGGEFLTTGKTVRHAALASKRCGHLCVGNRAPTLTRRRNNPTRRNLANLTAAMAAIHA